MLSYIVIVYNKSYKRNSIIQVKHKFYIIKLKQVMACKASNCFEISEMDRYVFNTNINYPQ